LRFATDGTVVATPVGLVFSAVTHRWAGRRPFDQTLACLFCALIHLKKRSLLQLAKNSSPVACTT
jgi:hypothetical protein